MRGIHETYGNTLTGFVILVHDDSLEPMVALATNIVPDDFPDYVADSIAEALETKLVGGV